MTEFTPYHALFGGMLMGISLSLILISIGNLETGTSILMGSVNPKDAQNTWRVNFIIGIILASGIYQWFMNAAVNPRVAYPLPAVALSGLLMGFGMKLGFGEQPPNHEVSAWVFFKYLLFLGMTFIGTALLSSYFLGL